jgi:Na+/citrate or Na+/malate symporter
MCCRCVFIVAHCIIVNGNGAGTNPSSEAYQKLMKESALLLPLVEGYQQLQQLHAEVGWSCDM